MSLPNEQLVRDSDSRVWRSPVFNGFCHLLRDSSRSHKVGQEKEEDGRPRSKE